jgi:hypothetical protein
MLICWLESTGDTARSDITEGRVRDDAAASFNYRPDLIGTAQDCAIAYRVSVALPATNTDNPASSLAP